MVNEGIAKKLARISSDNVYKGKHMYACTMMQPTQGYTNGIQKQKCTDILLNPRLESSFSRLKNAPHHHCHRCSASTEW